MPTIRQDDERVSLLKIAWMEAGRPEFAKHAETAGGQAASIIPFSFFVVPAAPTLILRQ